MTILDKIVKYKKREVRVMSAITPLFELESRKLFRREICSLSAAILDKTKTGIIAEFKRKSPSLGLINPNASVVEIAAGYIANGASGVSILTDDHFFGGLSSDITAARKESTFPILRKDFIISEYQVVESKAIGADAILLIAAAMKKHEILKLSELARSLGLEVLLEIHDESELDVINSHINIVGVNNRDLKTFEVNIENSITLAKKIPSGVVKISESGLSAMPEITRLRNAGYQGFLIGEKFMKTNDPVNAFIEFVKSKN